MLSLAPGDGGGNGAATGPGAGPGTADAPVTEPLDLAMLGRLADVIGRCTAAFETYDHARALHETEQFFWFFCDDYLELVKPRAYGEHGRRPPPVGRDGAAVRRCRCCCGCSRRCCRS